MSTHPLCRGVCAPCEWLFLPYNSPDGEEKMRATQERRSTIEILIAIKVGDTPWKVLACFSFPTHPPFRVV